VPPCHLAVGHPTVTGIVDGLMVGGAADPILDECPREFPGSFDQIVGPGVGTGQAIQIVGEGLNVVPAALNRRGRTGSRSVGACKRRADDAGRDRTKQRILTASYPIGRVYLPLTLRVP